MIFLVSFFSSLFFLLCVKLRSFTGSINKISDFSLALVFLNVETLSILEGLQVYWRLVNIICSYWRVASKKSSVSDLLKSENSWELLRKKHCLHDFHHLQLQGPAARSTWWQQTQQTGGMLGNTNWYWWQRQLCLTGLIGVLFVLMT